MSHAPSARTLRLATRGSPLAIAQADRVASQLRHVYPEMVVENVIISTTGDQDTTTPLSQSGGQGIFVKEIQLALLNGEADVAVHSAKDLPSLPPEGLELISVPERLDPADVLVGRSLEGLAPGACVATGSPRRKALLSTLRPDLHIVELRGNMATRLSLPGSKGVDAIVTAAAALSRLGQEALIAERFDPLTFTPQVGQGAIGLECRIGDPLGELVRVIDDVHAHRCLDAERSFLATLGAGCMIPAGAWCVAEEHELVLRAVMFNEQSHVLERHELRGNDPVALGQGIAALFSKGARGQ